MGPSLRWTLQSRVHESCAFTNLSHKNSQCRIAIASQSTARPENDRLKEPGPKGVDSQGQGRQGI